MHKYRDSNKDIQSSRKIAWVTKQASNESPMGKSMQMRMASPRPTGKIPGMGGIAKNPFNSIQKIKIPNPPSVPKIKVASQRWEAKNNFFPGTFEGRQAHLLKQDDIDNMTDEEYKIYRSQMNKVHRSNAVSGAAVATLGAPLGPGMLLAGGGIAASSPLLYKTKRRKKDREKKASQRLNERGEPYMKELDDPTFGRTKPRNLEEMYGVDPEFKSRKEQNARKRKVVKSELHDARLYSNLAGMLTSRKSRVARHKRLKKYKHDSKLEAMREGFFPSGEKTAGYSHDYYMKNRQKIKLRNKQYRMRNAAKLKLARKKYRRELKAGARRKAKRIRSGTQYISYGGF